MKDEEINLFARNFLAVVAGVLAAIAVGAILFPLVQIVFDKFFHLYLFATPPENAWKDDLVVLITMILWLFISSAFGGFICTIISTDREQVYSLISSLACLTFFFIISEIKVFEFGSWESWVLLLTIPIGNLFGSWIGSGFKRKRKKVPH